MAPAGRQRTFELVPNAPVLGQQHPDDDAPPIYSKPPMTTKQAKKLHNQKNKGPKLSKAEQRRIELMEQDRIRKEFEKEKAQARARTAREKKRAKEEKEKQDRKRKGLPLVDIHPSQDTISRFISRVGIAIGAKRVPTAANALDTVREEDSETATDAGESGTDAADEEEYGSDKENHEAVEESGAGRIAKRPRLSQPGEEDAVTRITPVPSQRRPGPLARIAQEYGAESYSRASSVDIDDSINQTLLDDQLRADLAQASSRSVAKQESDEQHSASGAAAEQPHASVPQLAAPTVPVSSAPKKPSQPCASAAQAQSPHRCIAPLGKDLSPPDPRTENRVTSHLDNNTSKEPAPPYVSATRPRPAIKPPAFRVPNAPPKFKSLAMQSNQSAERPKFLPKHLGAARQQRPSPAHHLRPAPVTTHTFPTSTQAFLFDHADELFPSATQEARELSEDILPQVVQPKVNSPRPSINGPMNRLESGIDVGATMLPPDTIPADPVLPAPAAGDPFDSSCILSQDFIISTQDILDIDTPSKAAPQLPTREILPAVNDELSPFVPHAEAIGANAFLPDTVQGYNQLSRNSPHSANVDTNLPCCQCGRLPASCRSQGYRSSCPAIRTQSSPQVMQREQQDHHQPAAASRPLRSSYQRLAAVTQQPQQDHHQQQRRRAALTLISTNQNHSTAAQVLNPLTTPSHPPPKKRMFGSSGPGPEGLVAMERSYQEMRRQERAREAQIRAQERAMESPSTLTVAELELDIVDFADDLLNDDFDESTCKGSSRRPSGSEQRDSEVQPLRPPGETKVLVASQETDYGDIDEDDFDFFGVDTSWLDEGLDDI